MAGGFVTAELVAAGDTAPVTTAPRFPAWPKWMEEHPGSCGQSETLCWKAMGCRRGMSEGLERP